MDDSDLRFETLNTQVALSTRLFDVCEVQRRGPQGVDSTFITLRTPDWANVIAVLPNEAGQPCFLMVRQYRHGSERLVWEFPGGMVETGEDPGLAALRELEEETGWRAETSRLLGSSNSNPAFLTNHVSTYLAEDLHFTGHHHLDQNEFVRVGLRPIEEVQSQMGQGEYDHGIMMMALWWWEHRRPDKV